MANCLLSLGSNLGDRGAHLQAALRSLSSLPQTKLLAQSSFRDTKPAGGPAAQDPFLNAAALIETSLTPQQILAELQRIENELGRVRTERWGPRTLDLDLLLYDQLELESLELTLPHPRTSFRRFVLESAAEIAAEMIHPINGWTIGRLLTHLNSSRPEIGLVPTYSKFCPQAPATRLLKSLVTELHLQAIFRRDLEQANPTPAQLARIQKKRASKDRLLPRMEAPNRPNARWVIRDFDTIQLAVEVAVEAIELFDDFVGSKMLESQSRLIVVWQPDDTPIIPLLDRARRNRECPPVLWIPKVSLEQARQEVIAAMAAME
jgi:2-amino-4-hydroxy-6-hydroxymethyldihydropteridine diphosphokinase